MQVSRPQDLLSPSVACLLRSPSVFWRRLLMIGRVPGFLLAGRILNNHGQLPIVFLKVTVFLLAPARSGPVRLLAAGESALCVLSLPLVTGPHADLRHCPRHSNSEGKAKSAHIEAPLFGVSNARKSEVSKYRPTWYLLSPAALLPLPSGCWPRAVPPAVTALSKSRPRHSGLTGARATFSSPANKQLPHSAYLVSSRWL